MGLEEKFGESLNDSREFHRQAISKARQRGRVKNTTKRRDFDSENNGLNSGNRVNFTDLKSPDTNSSKANNLLNFLDSVESEKEDLSFDNAHKAAADYDQPKKTSSSLRYDWEADSDDDYNVSYEFGRSTGKSGGNSREIQKKLTGLSLELDDKGKTIEALKQALTSARKERDSSIKSLENEMAERLDQQREEHEKAVNRHLGFIDKLLADKKQLAKKVEDMSSRMKKSEQNVEKKLKEIQAKHQDDMGKLRQNINAAEAAKRKKWQEDKARELKDITIKGLEPEIQKILSKHKDELRSLEQQHKDKLKTTYEKCAAQKEQALKEAHAKAELEQNKAIARLRLNQETNEQEAENRLKKELSAQRDRFHKELEDARTRHLEEIKKMNQKEQEKQEQLNRRHKDVMHEVERRHNLELASLKEKYNIEKEQWQSKLVARLHSKSTEEQRLAKERLLRERDSQLEAVISKLHEEQAEKEFQMKEELNRLAETEKRKAHDRVNESREAEKKWRQKYINLKNSHDEEQRNVSSAERRVRELSRQAEEREAKIIDLNREVALVHDKLAEREREVRSEYVEKIKISAEKVNQLEEEIERKQNEISTIQRMRKLDLEKINSEKEDETEEIHKRVRQMIKKKDETISNLKLHLEKVQSRLKHSEALLEKQRQEFINFK